MLAVMYGTVFAQALQLLMSPVFTRVFEPKEIGLLTVFVVLPNVIIPAIGGRFELAMILPRFDRHARIVLGFAVKTSIAISLIFFAATAVAISIGVFPDLKSLRGLAWLVPVYTFLSGQVFILQFVLNRSGQFKRIGQTRLLVAIFTSTFSITFGVLGWGSTGLILGAFIAQCLTLIILSRWVRNWLGPDILLWPKRSSPLLRKYRTYPLLLAPSSLLDGITLALPVLILNRFCGDDVVGWFGLMTRIAVAPITVISSSIRQVNLSVVAELVNSGRSARRHVLKIGALLWISTIIPLGIILLWGPDLAALVFGEQWRESGVYLQILGPAMAARLVATPLSMTIGATRNNHLSVIWGITGFFSTLIVLLATALSGGDARAILVNFGICDFLVYIFLQGLIVYAAGRPKK